MKHTCPWLVAIALVLAVSSEGWAFFFHKKPIHPEYQVLVADWYARYLCRPADAGAIETWGRKLMRGDSPREVEGAILGSREYYIKNGGNNVGFIRGLYRDVLATQPAPGQLEYWLEKLNDIEYRDELAEDFLKAARKGGAPLPPLGPPTIVVSPPVFNPQPPSVPAYPAFPTGPGGVDIRVNVGPRVNVQVPFSGPGIPAVAIPQSSFSPGGQFQPLPSPAPLPSETFPPPLAQPQALPQIPPPLPQPLPPPRN